MQAQQTGKLYR